MPHVAGPHGAESHLSFEYRHEAINNNRLEG